MRRVELGTRGLLNADMRLVRSCSFSATLVHEDEKGQPIDHTGWSAWCRIQGDGIDVDLTDRVAFGEGGEIAIYVPDEVTATIPAGAYGWDLIVEDATGYATCIAYGAALVYDSHARDGEE